MDIVKGMQAFASAVERGSFAAAAEQLDMSTAAISRQIAALEAHLGARLFNRTTRRLSLTEAGQAFYERTVQILGELAEAEAIAGQHSARPHGLLRISAPLSFGVRTLGGLLPDFREHYPELRLDIDLTDRMADLAHDGIDVAIRIARSPSPHLIVRKIASIRMVACASPAYLARLGTPLEPADLAGHDMLSYSYLGSGNVWTFFDAAGTETSVRLHPTVHASNGDLLRDLAVADGGIIVQPLFIVGDDLAHGRLVPILADWSIGTFNLYAAYLNRKFLSAKVRVFIDFLTAKLGKAEL